MCLHAPTAKRQLNFARQRAYVRTLPGHVTMRTHVRTCHVTYATTPDIVTFACFYRLLAVSWIYVAQAPLLWRQQANNELNLSYWGTLGVIWIQIWLILDQIIHKIIYQFWPFWVFSGPKSGFSNVFWWSTPTTWLLATYQSLFIVFSSQYCSSICLDPFWKIFEKGRKLFFDIKTSTYFSGLLLDFWKHTESWV